MRVRFEKCCLPCVSNEAVLWHLDHGWVWDAIDRRSGERFGVLYCTLLCGDGAIAHFDIAPGCRPSPALFLTGMRHGLEMISPVCGVLFATVPAKRARFVRILIRLGFGITDAGFRRDGEEILMLKYFPGKKSILTANQPEKEE